MRAKEWPLGGDSQGPEVSRRAAGSTAVMLPREATVVSLDAWRRRLPPGPDQCPSWCEWCYGPNRLGGRWSS
jgi:hypothetical protein